MTMLENVHGQYVIAEATSSPTAADKLRTKIKFILDRLEEEPELNLPHGWSLHGTVTNDHHGNIGLYVFLRDKDGKVHSATGSGNDVDYIKETVGGRWVRLNKDVRNRTIWESYYGLPWEAKQIQRAVEELKGHVK